MSEAIFLSVGVPDPTRGGYAQTADTVAITAAVSALGWGLIQIHAIIMAARARPER
jgi:hypothetical protein